MRNTYLGLFFTSLAALMLEILLTRVFSVASWYYFAFFAISVAMFGFTVGALYVYLFKEYFPQDLLNKRLAAFALAFGVSVDIALMVFLSVPFYPRLTGTGVFATAFTYLAIAVPFFAAGVVVCLCLTRFPGKVGLFYAADLIGAGIGAFMVFPVLHAMDAPTAVFLVGAIGALGALFFSKTVEGESGSRLEKASGILFAVLTGVMLVNYFYQPVRVEWVKKKFNTPQMEAWNSFSRIAVYPLQFVKIPYNWGLSASYKPKEIIGERMIDIDGVSETVMTMWDGKPESAGHLKYDITSIAHYLRSDAKVFIIGVGGGRDILAAQAFRQKEVVGAEINNRTLDMINIAYGDFTGHLDKLPNVRIINDEARSVITRTDEKFDIIQASCIATWSATTAGAFTLAENSLYTVEAWKTFYNRLSPNGILSFNRWYSPDYPAQLLRMAGLASYTLRGEGITEPGRHIAVARSEGAFGHHPSATLLISKAPFTDEDIGKLRDAVDGLKFRLEYDPKGYQNPWFKEVIDRAGEPGFFESIKVDLAPPTDDRPFFFYMIRFKQLFTGDTLTLKEQKFSFDGVIMLFILMGVSIVLSAVFIFGPLFIFRKKAPLPAGPGAIGLLFFASIGFGYILIEIGLLQRLIIFLGHPIYSITVVIFSMLVSSGLGSMFSSYITKDGIKAWHIGASMAVILALLVASIYLQPGLLSSFERESIGVRILLSLVFLMPLGFFMGLPFPYGMTLASMSQREHTPWFWAVNGATGVVSSVMSVCISITSGFTATLLVGLGFYVIATITLLAFHSITARSKAV